MATQTSTAIAKSPRARYEALKTRIAKAREISESLDDSLLNRGLAYGTAAGVALYETHEKTVLFELGGVDGKLIAGAALVIGGEVLARAGSGRSSRVWGDRIASLGDGPLIVGIADACRRGSIFVK